MPNACPTAARIQSAGHGISGTVDEGTGGVTISGIGELGHIAVQYAAAMGLHVAAIDVDDGKLALARSLGAEVTVNATTSDAAAEVQQLASLLPASPGFGRIACVRTWALLPKRPPTLGSSAEVSAAPTTTGRRRRRGDRDRGAAKDARPMSRPI